MVDFMIGARHYVGSTDVIQPLSWAWRDGDTFNWALRSLVAQYLSNPAAYQQMERKITYLKNESFPQEYQGKWGKLTRYNPDAPDIVKLIHWDADVKVSQALEHEHQKAELAHFLYAFPYLKKWLPQQNFDVVYEYAKEKWSKSTVAPYSTTRYDKSPEHNLLALKTQLGTTKGELPPGHSVIPNLMMYEVAKRIGEPDADKYFDAAYQQMEWLIQNLDWNDPMTTKGQRLSEHITMRAFGYFLQQYPDKAPNGLYQRVKEWAEVAIDRSDNMWDFRKYEKEGDWIPYGWNETGNVLGFPASALAAMSVLKESNLLERLDQMVWAHFDNAFGRNPTGRHSSYDGPREIEGVDLGWYSFHHGGIGLLEDVPFVFDGSPKSYHYPNNPEVGNLGWTEGWVQFNTAFNMSIAYLANYDTDITLIQLEAEEVVIRLKAPLNFGEKKVDEVDLILRSANGEKKTINLIEEGPYSRYFSARIEPTDHFLNRGEWLSVSYGLGYFEKVASLKIE